MFQLNRRRFMTGLGAFSLGTALGGESAPKSPSKGEAKGLPPVYDYWCTWGIQNGLAAAKLSGEFSEQTGAECSRGARLLLDEKHIFGAGGWADFFPESRSQLYMLLDDGWDVAKGVDPAVNLALWGTLEPSADRFGSLGATPDQRLAGINRALRDRGWRGAGLWVAAQHFTESKLEASARAGIGYWKIDWGFEAGNNAYRRRISEAKKKIYPELIIEHMPMCNGVFNGNCTREWGRLADEPSAGDVDRMTFADVVRVYDMLGPVETATVLERVRYYSLAAERGGNGTVLNVEDNPVVGAVLGHSFGLMRYPGAAAGNFVMKSVVVGAVGIDEVKRALAWRRVAPVFGARRDFATTVSRERICASYPFRRGQGWAAFAWGREIHQTAPMVIARGTPLPEVACREEKRPFVLACRHPNGALAVAVLPPLSQNEAPTPRTAVTLAETFACGVPVGVFGEPEAVTFKDGLGSAARLFVRDLLGGRAEEITAAVVRRDGRVTIPGDVLARGRVKSTDGSMPGVLLEART